MPVIFLSMIAAVASVNAAALDAERAAHPVVLAVHAEGAQVYECKAGQDGALHWSFREPIATLILDGRTTGRHYAGPHWALDDGSLVDARAVASAAGATSADIPSLKLAIAGNNGTGALALAAWVYRVHTHGGNLAGVCSIAATLEAVPYSADYVFAK